MEDDLIFFKLTEEKIVLWEKHGKIRPLLAALRREQKGNLTRNLIESLGRMRNPKTAQALVTLFKIPQQRFYRWDVIDALLSIGNQPVLEELVKETGLDIIERCRLITGLTRPAIFLDYVSCLQMTDYLEYQRLVSSIQVTILDPKIKSTVLAKLASRHATLRPYHWETVRVTCPACGGDGEIRNRFETSDCYSCENRGYQENQVQVFDEPTPIVETVQVTTIAFTSLPTITSPWTAVMECTTSEERIAILETMFPEGSTERGRTILKAIVSLTCYNNHDGQPDHRDCIGSKKMNLAELVGRWATTKNCWIEPTGSGKLVIGDQGARTEYRHYIYRVGLDEFFVSTELYSWD